MTSISKYYHTCTVSKNRPIQNTKSTELVSPSLKCDTYHITYHPSSLYTQSAPGTDSNHQSLLTILWEIFFFGKKDLAVAPLERPQYLMQPSLQCSYTGTVQGPAPSIILPGTSP